MRDRTGESVIVKGLHAKSRSIIEISAIHDETQYQAIVRFLWRLEKRADHVLKELNQIAGMYTREMDDYIFNDSSLQSLIPTYETLPEYKHPSFQAFAEAMVDWGKRYHFISLEDEPTNTRTHIYFDSFLRDVFLRRSKVMLATFISTDEYKSMMEYIANHVADLLGLFKSSERAKLIEAFRNPAYISLVKAIRKDLTEFQETPHVDNPFAFTPTITQEELDPTQVNVFDSDNVPISWDPRLTRWTEFKSRLDALYEKQMEAYKRNIESKFPDHEIKSGRKAAQHFDYFIQYVYLGETYDTIAGTQQKKQKESNNTETVDASGVGKEVRSLSEILLIPAKRGGPRKRSSPVLRASKQRKL